MTDVVEAGVPSESELTAAWFTEVMAEASHGAVVTAARLDSMPTADVGWFGRLLRAHLVYDRPGAGPATVVLKLHPPDDFVREIGFGLGFFQREVGFYRDLAPGVPIPVPTCHRAAVDEVGQRYVLVLEDLAGGRFGDQGAGCTAEEAETLARELAALHAWGVTTAKPKWLESLEAPPFLPSYADAFAGLVERYRGRVPEEALQIGARVGERFDDVYAALGVLPATVTHGDFRLDNVVFDLGDSAWPLVYDWQSTSLAPGALDLAGLLVLALETDERRAAEGRILEVYRDAVAELGGPIIDPSELRRAYDLSVVHWFVLAVATMQAGSPDRVAFVTWCLRAAAALSEIDLESLL